MIDKIQGLCASTYCPTLVERVVKGYIFQCADTRLGYYNQPGLGTNLDKALAQVFTAQEARKAARDCAGWGSKEEGKWLVVYE